ncbi:MAG: cupin domain-containing protein [Deltaproteobacteria bacterium]|nr:cupin domain-containing protein [Deltaproteobacteria bacterium]
MWIPSVLNRWKSIEDRAVTARIPETLELYNEIIEQKRKSRIMMRRDEIKWKVADGGVKVANLIDFRLGFQNTLANLAISEVPPGDQASDGHTHGEAYIYWLEGEGYSIVGDGKYNWGPGDAMYVPPDTFHQHFVTSKTPAKYLRIIPSPLLMNLLAVMASLGPYLKPEAQK